MKIILKLEEAAMFAAAIFAFSRLSFAWWWFPVLILLPDIGMIGYLINKKVGAFIYNLFHHKALAMIVYVVGLTLKNEILQLIGIILFGHSSMDRMLGYGLKFSTGFKNTHLGMIGS